MTGDFQLDSGITSEDKSAVLNVRRNGAVVMFKKGYDLELGNPMDLSGHRIEDGGKVLLKPFSYGITLVRAIWIT